MKKIDYRHFLCVIITLGFLACAVFVFPNAFGRIIESGRDFGTSAAYWFLETIGIPHELRPTVNDMPVLPFFEQWGSGAPSTDLSETFEGFQAQWSAYWQLWASLPNFVAYLYRLSQIIFYIAQGLTLVIPLIMMFVMLFKRHFKVENNDYNKDSKPLKVYKKISGKCSFVKDWCIEFFDFIQEHSAYWKIWLFIWLYSFNIIAIAIEFFAFYMYFAVSFDFLGIYFQVRKLFIDLSAPITFIPFWIWIIAGIVVVLKIRRDRAFAVLDSFEYQNRAFVNLLPVVTMICGSMGKGKTTMLTDMALSQEIIFRDKAFELMLENDLKFPNFPWLNFVVALRKEMEAHRVSNLATCRRFIREVEERFLDSLEAHKLDTSLVFDYNFERYGLFYNNKLKVVTFFDVLESYAQLFFIYMGETLLISNYSVRTDNVLVDKKNMPRWDTELFRRDSRLQEAYSRHSHILDFDMLRLGRHVMENNPRADAFEFGVILVTEIGKERGNQIENRGKKKTDAEANTENDLMNQMIKMIRHNATVDNFTFVKFITDEQRAASWGADARDLCEIVQIEDKDDGYLAMPFFALGELIFSFVSHFFKKLYIQYQHNRGDNTLLMHLIKAISSRIINRHKHIYNEFGYYKLAVRVESGIIDDKRNSNAVYRIMSMKAFSDRFSTDCFAGFFNEKSLRSQMGLNDIPMFAATRASFDEMGSENSYFFKDLISSFLSCSEEEQQRRDELEFVEQIKQYIAGLSELELDKAIKAADLARKTDKLIEIITQHPELMPGNGRSAA